MSTQGRWGSSQDERNLSERDLRELMCEIGRRMWVKDMAPAKRETSPAAWTKKRVLATPTFICKGFMKPADLVVVDMRGNKLSGRREPTSETNMHLAAYACRNDITAVCHAHPQYVLAVAATHTPVPASVLMDVEYLVGAIAVLPTTEPAATVDIADDMKPALRKHRALILSQHGALTLGRGLIEAFWIMEILESLCSVLVNSRKLGKLKRFTKDQMSDIREAQETIRTGLSRQRMIRG